MKYLFVVFILLSLTRISFSQQKFNPSLKKKLDSVFVLDQKYREAITYLSDPAKKDSVAKSLSMTVGEAFMHCWYLQNHLDSLNILFIEDIIQKYGYPGKTMVGEPTNESAWNIIQHSQKIHQYMPLMKKVADKNELPFHLYAMMLDRDLMNQGKEQIYGSQISCRVIKSGKNECFVWPIQDSTSVNKRRKKAGFDLTVEQNAKRLGIDYRIVKLSEIKGIKE
jgi:hypothetical protein